MAVDDFITPKRVDGIWLFALAFFGVFLFRFIFSYVQEILLNNVGQRVMFDLRTELFTKLQQQEIAYYDHYPVVKCGKTDTVEITASEQLKQAALSAKSAAGEPKLNALLVATRNNGASDFHLAVGQLDLARLPPVPGSRG